MLGLVGRAGGQFPRALRSGQTVLRDSVGFSALNAIGFSEPPRAVGDTAIERHADEADVDLVEPRPVRKAEEFPMWPRQDGFYAYIPGGPGGQEDQPSDSYARVKKKLAPSSIIGCQLLPFVTVGTRLFIRPATRDERVRLSVLPQRADPLMRLSAASSPEQSSRDAQVPGAARP
jgi:hypothetical protein